MGIDIYSYAKIGDKLVEFEDVPNVDWQTVLGHPMVETVKGYADKPVEVRIEPGYIRESYHGAPYPTHEFLPETYEHDQYEKFGGPDEDGYYGQSGVHVPVTVLRARLDRALELAEERMRVVYECTDPTQIADYQQQYRDFVAAHEYLARGDIKTYILNSY